LITLGVKILVVVSGELPIVETSVGVAIGGAIGIEPGRQDCCGGGRVRPEFNVEKVRGVVPGRRWVQGRLAFRGEWIIESFQHKSLLRNLFSYVLLSASCGVSAIRVSFTLTEASLLVTLLMSS
jgi:hypothetical protein